MSETDAERIARLEERMSTVETAISEQRPMLQDIQHRLDVIRGGSRMLYAVVAASVAIGGLVADLIRRIGS